jgi:phospholipase/lecithinase/hemolysin
MNRPRFLPSLRTRPLAAALLAALLVACGGGTSQIDAFNAKHVVAFGDELSALTSDGRKYIVNRLDDSDVVDCEANPIWVQALAAIYGFVFAECNPENVVEPKAVMRAEAGARVADLTTQIDAQLAGDGVGDDTLVTVLVGANDVIDLYGDYPNTGRSALLAEATRRGEAIATQVNRLVGAGARVIVATVPDMGLTPYALAEKAANDDIDRAELITDLTTALNTGLRTTVLNDGRYIGLALADEMVQAMAKVPSAFGVANIKDGACAVALPACTDATMVSGADATTWLWADAQRMGFNAQNRLAILAISRARNNPF